MEWKDILWELVQMIESSAPKAWEIAIRQVYVYTVKSFGGGIVLMLFTVLGTILIEKLNKNAEESGFYSGEWRILYIVIAMTLIFGVCLIFDGIGYLINPEYYAIKALTDLINISQ